MRMRLKFAGRIRNFGQQDEHTCGLACLRYLLWQHGINHSERELLNGIIKDNDKGFTAAEIAEAGYKLGLIPSLRCLKGYGWVIGKAPRSWLQEGDEKELENWLRQKVHEKKCVVTSLDLNFLGCPYKRDPVFPQLHSVVVTHIEGNLVKYLETDDPLQNGYPKRGRLMSCDFGRFKEAWGRVGYIAIHFDKA